MKMTWDWLRLVILPGRKGNCQALPQDWISEIKATVCPIRSKKSPNTLAADAAIDTVDCSLQSPCRNEDCREGRWRSCVFTVGEVVAYHCQRLQKTAHLKGTALGPVGIPCHSSMSVNILHDQLLRCDNCTREVPSRSVLAVSSPAVSTLAILVEMKEV